MASATVELATPVGPRWALVLSPTRDIVVSSVGLAAGPSETDRWILREARAAVDSDLASLCIFRARAGAGDGAYRFSETLTPDEAVGLAETMLEGQLEVYRELVHLGICLFVHTDFGYGETEAYRTAVQSVALDLEARSRGGSPQARRAKVDLWILQNLVFFFTLSFEKLALTVLPDKLPMLEKRMERIRRMVARARLG